jgi:hypothetical protein
VTLLITAVLLPPYLLTSPGAPNGTYSGSCRACTYSILGSATCSRLQDREQCRGPPSWPPEVQGESNSDALASRLDAHTQTRLIQDAGGYACTRLVDKGIAVTSPDRHTDSRQQITATPLPQNQTHTTKPTQLPTSQSTDGMPRCKGPACRLIWGTRALLWTAWRQHLQNHPQQCPCLPTTTTARSQQDSAHSECGRCSERGFGGQSHCCGRLGVNICKTILSNALASQPKPQPGHNRITLTPDAGGRWGGARVLL